MWKCERCGASTPKTCTCRQAGDATPPATPEPPRLAINDRPLGLAMGWSQPPAASGDVERPLRDAVQRFMVTLAQEVQDRAEAEQLAKQHPNVMSEEYARGRRLATEMCLSRLSDILLEAGDRPTPGGTQ